MSIISDRCAKALQAAILAACAEVTQYPKQSAVLSLESANFRQPVLDVVYSAFGKYAQELTALHSAAARLPDELLVEIFSLLGFRDKVRTATVCHRWRDVSLRAPARLWSTVPTLADPDAWAALLDRSRTAPVTLEPIRMDHRSKRVFVILRQHVHHIRHLELVFPSGGWDSGDWGTAADLNCFLELTSPALHSLALHFHEEQSETGDILIIPPSAALQTVKLHSVRLSCLSSCAGSSALRVLVIEVLEDRVFPTQDWSFLSSFAALEELCLRLNGRPPRNCPALCIDLPRTLIHLHLEMDPAFFRLLIDSLIPQIGRVSRWKICVPEGLCTVREVLPLLAGPFVDVAVRYSYDIDFMVREPSGAQRVLQYIMPDGSWFEVLADVERLSLAILINALKVFPAEILDTSFVFSALRELTFDMSLPLGLSDRHIHAVQWPYGPCPRLRVVRVRALGYAVRVRAASIVSALTQLLGAPSRQMLALLVFDNILLVAHTDTDIDTDTDSDGDMNTDAHPDTDADRDAEASADLSASFHPYAETVSFQMDGAKWPECYNVWDNVWGDIHSLQCFPPSFT